MAAEKGIRAVFKGSELFTVRTKEEPTDLSLLFERIQNDEDTQIYNYFDSDGEDKKPITKETGKQPGKRFLMNEKDLSTLKKDKGFYLVFAELKKIDDDDEESVAGSDIEDIIEGELNKGDGEGQGGEEEGQGEEGKGGDAEGQGEGEAPAEQPQEIPEPDSVKLKSKSKEYEALINRNVNASLKTIRSNLKQSYRAGAGIVCIAFVGENNASTNRDYGIPDYFKEAEGDQCTQYIMF